MRSRVALPNFLVIGAMKSGTTTLYSDLASQPAICMSSVKEPAVLVRMSSGEATAHYPKLFRPAGQDHLGEASTQYSMIPRYTGVAARARAVLGRELRIIYLVRNPVERAVSHHYHLIGRRHSREDIDVLVRSNQTLVDFGRYAMQLDPWIDAFGLDRVLVLRFEDYVSDRGAAMKRVGAFLGVSVDVGLLPVDRAFNQGEESRAPGILRPLIRSDAYSLWLRRAVPAGVRARLRRVLLPRVAGARPRPSADTIAYLIDRLSDDGAALARALDWPALIWDLEATRAKYAPRAEAPADAP